MKKKFYDVLTIIYVVLILILFIVSKFFVPSFLTQLFILHEVIPIIMAVYWLFILILGIKLREKKLVKNLDIILAFLLSPIAIIFYLFYFRKKLKT